MIRRALQVILALALTSGGAVILGSTAAAAQPASYSCVHSKNITLYNHDGVSHVVMTARWQCSDNRFHASGTLYDDKCDARSARLAMIANGLYLPGLDEYMDQWSWDTNASNGCGTYSTFSMSEPAVEIGSEATQGDVQILVGACSVTCSSYTQYELLITYTGGGGGCATPAHSAAAARRTPAPNSIPC
jgi:hypothetical protein